MVPTLVENSRVLVINIVGACATISFFWCAWIVEVLFEQFLIRNAVQWVEHS